MISIRSDLVIREMKVASEESVNRVVHEMTDRVADLRASVTPALEVEDVSMIEFGVPISPRWSLW